MKCSTCGSDNPDVPMIMLDKDGVTPIDCHNSFHPVQQIPLSDDAQHLTKMCGPHCGVKDNIAGHCDKSCCHDGQRKKQGLKKLTHLGGQSVRGVRPD